jgi:hypothetical protein
LGTAHSNEPTAVCVPAGRFQKCDAAGFDNFFAADGAGAFARFGFEADLEWAYAQDARNTMTDGVLVIRQFWPFGVNDAIEVHDDKASFGDLSGCGREHFGRIASAIGGIRVGEQPADIGQGGGPQESIGYCVEEHVGIAVTDKLSVMGHIDTAQPLRPAGGCAVRIFADANTEIARGGGSQTVPGN